MMIFYLIGVAINLLLTIIEESGFKQPIWKVVVLWPKQKDTWISALDKVLFIVGSFFSYFIFGIIYYVTTWRK